MLKRLIILLAFFIFASCSETRIDKVHFPDNIECKVIGVIDGDTIDILYEEMPVRIRLSYIDCPEMKNHQPFSRNARQFTSDYCFGKVVKVKHGNQYDQWGRLHAEIITSEGDNLNKSLIAAGLAWHYQKHSTDPSYAMLEIEAKNKRYGLWQDEHSIPPWEWRRIKKSHKPLNTTTNEQ